MTPENHVQQCWCTSHQKFFIILFNGLFEIGPFGWGRQQHHHEPATGKELFLTRTGVASLLTTYHTAAVRVIKVHMYAPSQSVARTQQQRSFVGDMLQVATHSSKCISYHIYCCCSALCNLSPRTYMTTQQPSIYNSTSSHAAAAAIGHRHVCC